MKITVAVDVQNPLLGLKGATRVYGPQKGLREKDFSIAESALGKLAQVLNKKSFKKGFRKNSWRRRGWRTWFRFDGFCPRQTRIRF